MWNLYIVVDGVEHQAFMEEPYKTEEEVTTACNTLRKIEDMYLGLKNGDFICLNKDYCNFHFLIKKVI